MFFIIFFIFQLLVIGHWQYLRIRVTKSDVKFLTAALFPAEGDDHPSNPKDSSLYAWYAENISKLSDQFNDFHQKLEELLVIYEKEKIKNQASTFEVQKCSA